MRSIDLLSPCSTPNTGDELQENHDSTLIDNINATLKEVSNSITESNADIKNALNNLTNTTKKETETETEKESEE